MKTGVRIMHNGRAVELLHKISHTEEGQTWRARLLFVDPVETDILIRPNDICKPLHAQCPR